MHSHFVGFVMRRLIYICTAKIYDRIGKRVSPNSFQSVVSTSTDDILSLYSHRVVEVVVQLLNVWVLPDVCIRSEGQRMCFESQQRRL